MLLVRSGSAITLVESASETILCTPGVVQGQSNGKVLVSPGLRGRMPRLVGGEQSAGVITVLVNEVAPPGALPMLLVLTLMWTISPIGMIMGLVCTVAV